eukprot:6545637-Alexandrium_andersonii.AAC.1
MSMIFPLPQLRSLRLQRPMHWSPASWTLPLKIPARSAASRWRLEKQCPRGPGAVVISFTTRVS